LSVGRLGDDGGWFLRLHLIVGFELIDFDLLVFEFCIVIDNLLEFSFATFLLLFVLLTALFFSFFHPLNINVDKNSFRVKAIMDDAKVRVFC